MAISQVNPPARKKMTPLIMASRPLCLRVRYRIGKPSGGQRFNVIVLFPSVINQDVNDANTIEGKKLDITRMRLE